MKNLLFLVLTSLSFSVAAQIEYTSEMLQTASKNVKNIAKYTASDGSEWSVGDRITLGSASGSNQFSFASMGSGAAVTLLGAAWAGTELEVKKIRVTGTKRMGFRLWLTCKMDLSNIHVNCEQAIASGELVTTGYTSDKALEELKRAKDKLDLGLITQEEFDSLKAELAKFIE